MRLKQKERVAQGKGESIANPTSVLPELLDQITVFAGPITTTIPICLPVQGAFFPSLLHLS